MTLVGAGPVLLAAALALELYGIAASLYGARTGRARWCDSGRRTVYTVAILLTVAFGILELAFLRSDFSVKVVADHSSTTTPPFYRAAAAWSAQEGSLLLWVWLLSLWSSLILFLTRRSMRALVPYAQAVLLGFAAFFTGLTLFLANPFATQSPAPTEGIGLNPLLRHPSMMIHPPMLYSGYTLFTVPFAFAVAALVTRRVDAEWLRSIRRFALAAWLLLGLGVLLGARWSYAELGWGGYWGWDPVENASLMPWLTGTAFLHSLQVQEKRGALKTWNVSLALVTGILAVLGTFLVRSGILESIHAFGASTLGGPFLAFIAVLLVGSVALVASRRDSLRSRPRLDSLVSRETAFLVNNLVLVGLCFVIFWGTFFPLISEAVTGTKQAVGPPWFDRYTTPLALLLVLLSGIGPALAWGRTSRSRLPRLFAVPVAAAVLTLFLLALTGGLSPDPFAGAMFCVAAFALASVVQEIWRGTRARRILSGEPVPLALASLLRHNRRRYGGYVVHIGFVLLLVGVAASSAFQHASDVRLAPGQTARVGSYDIRYLGPTSSLDAAKVSLGAVLDVSSHGRHVATLTPSRDYYTSLDQRQFGRIGRFFEGDSTSELGLRSGVGRDIWTAVQPDLTPITRYIREANRRFPDANAALEGFLVKTIVTRYVRSAPAAEFRLIVSPLVAWIWIGGVIAVGGAMIAIWPAPSAARRRAPARAPADVREPSRA
ncbi:MAG: cytochrome c-type biosis protein CcmF [Thermoleophilaceae bacterium]|nr:cytochrome c-type biosis protein CcmF [Thermoleophilaceae bacterium]